MNKLEMNQESLSRATGGQSTANYSSIYRGFMAKGIHSTDAVS